MRLARLRWLLLAISLAGFLVTEVKVSQKNHVDVYFFDVGQGDSALIVGPRGEQIVIDGGPDLSALEGLGRTMSFFDRSIDLLVLSHPNLDHFASFAEILRRYQVKGILLTGVPFEGTRYRELLQEIHARGTSVYLADPDEDITFDDGLTLDILWPKRFIMRTPMKNVNDSSVTLRARFGSDAVLFTGDIEKDAEEEIVATGEDLRADVLKVAHHGSKTSSATGFLLAVSPSLGVISVGRDNTYGHPHPQILSRFAALRIPLRTTAKEGMIHVTMDGKL